jgi:hypothetical protein
MEDEHGPINVIVKPKIYERDRSAVRMEPFLTVRGRLQKDGASMNVIAFEVAALRAGARPGGEPLEPSLPGTLEYWGERGGERTAATDTSGWERDAETLAEQERARDALVEIAAGADRASSQGEVSGSLPQVRNYWGSQTLAGESAFRYLTAGGQELRVRRKRASPPQRIPPSQPRETREVGIGGIQLGLVLDRERGQVGVRGQVRRGTEVPQQTEQDRSVPLPRVDQESVRLSEP